MTVQEKERLRQVETLFDGALDYPVGLERDTWLTGCAADPETLAEVRRLLDGDARLTALVPAASEPLPRFGPWKATRLLGRGGMGMVYLAERADGAFQMKAAVKVVPLALASPEIEERFRRERQFLASLDHPGIARLIDGGVTGAGLPYLVMEFVDGLHIDSYCVTRRLDERARIELMRQVLDALTYIHTRSVVHRDLKPSNILADAGGNPRLLDFGLATLVNAGGDGSITNTGVFAFTPDYASPEQAQGRPVTYSSDIYSAGVVLHRLLTGRVPGRDEPKPSGLAAPLDRILAKALRIAPEERYGSAAEMDADLARYLGGDRVRAHRPGNARRIAAFASAVAAIALLAAGGSWMLHRQADAPPSVAVLPFTNRSGQAANQYLADGITDEITDSLARVKGLRVIARSSAFRFAGKAHDVREAGRVLNVNSVLEGSVDRFGDRVRITASLERAGDATLVWSRTWERNSSDSFALQAEVVAAIADGLKLGGRVPPPAHVPDPEARDLMMKGIYDMQAMTTESLTRAEQNLQHAIDKDPRYAAAYFALGSAKLDQSVVRGADAERAGVEKLVRKALDLDPGLSAAHAALADIAMQYDWDWNTAERELTLGLEGSPNVNVETAYATLLTYQGRLAEAAQHIRRLEELDPYSTHTQLNVAVLLDWQGSFREAREHARRVALEFPGMLAAQLVIAHTLLMDGDPELALKTFRKVEPSFPGARLGEAMVLAKEGRRAEALGLIRRFEESYPNSGAPVVWIAMVYSLLGDGPNTLKWLERSADRHEGLVLFIGVSPHFAFLRDSPGFRALEKRIGLIR